MGKKIFNSGMIINFILLLFNIYAGNYSSLLFAILMAIFTVLKLIIYRKESKKMFLFFCIVLIFLHFFQ